jgi:hypothetical protein
MSVSTLLIYAKSTGQVLAGTTLVAAPSDGVKPDAIAGAFLPVRYKGDTGAGGFAPTVFVPADQLDVFATDSQTVNIRQARDWMIAIDSQKNKTLTPLPANPLTVAPPSATAITITLTVPTSIPVNVWARVQPAGATDPAQLSSGLTVAGVTPAAAANTQVTVSLPLVGLTLGQYYSALVLATGFQAHLEVFQAS